MQVRAVCGVAAHSASEVPLLGPWRLLQGWLLGCDMRCFLQCQMSLVSTLMRRHLASLLHGPHTVPHWVPSWCSGGPSACSSGSIDTTLSGSSGTHAWSSQGPPFLGLTLNQVGQCSFVRLAGRCCRLHHPPRIHSGLLLCMHTGAVVMGASARCAFPQHLDMVICLCCRQIQPSQGLLGQQPQQ